jgi:hypothetical protein
MVIFHSYVSLPEGKPTFQSEADFHPSCSFNELPQQEPHVRAVAVQLRIEHWIATPHFQALAGRICCTDVYNVGNPMP